MKKFPIRYGLNEAEFKEFIDYLKQNNFKPCNNLLGAGLIELLDRETGDEVGTVSARAFESAGRGDAVAQVEKMEREGNYALSVKAGTRLETIAETFYENHKSE